MTVQRLGGTKEALQECDDDIRHLDLEYMVDLPCDHFYWPKMTKVAEAYIAVVTDAFISTDILKSCYAEH